MKPDPDKPWCKKCRAHTPNEEQQIAAGYDNQGMRTFRAVYKCLKCDGIEMFIPASRVPWGIVFGCLPILLSPVVLLALWMGDWTPVIVILCTSIIYNGTLLLIPKQQDKQQLCDLGRMGEGKWI